MSWEQLPLVAHLCDHQYCPKKDNGNIRSDCGALSPTGAFLPPKDKRFQKIEHSFVAGKKKAELL